MEYAHVEPAVFLRRPNRFLAQVRTDRGEETVHVKNTGRCRELLVPGGTVWLSRSDNPARKTRYDLIAAEKALPAWLRADCSWLRASDRLVSSSIPSM